MRKQTCKHLGTCIFYTSAGLLFVGNMFTPTSGASPFQRALGLFLQKKLGVTIRLCVDKECA